VIELGEKKIDYDEVRGDFEKYYYFSENREDDDEFYQFKMSKKFKGVRTNVGELTYILDENDNLYLLEINEKWEFLGERVFNEVVERFTIEWRDSIFDRPISIRYSGTSGMFCIEKINNDLVVDLSDERSECR